MRTNWDIETPEQKKARKDRNKAIIDEHKLDNPCEYCGIADLNTGFYAKPGKKARKFSHWPSWSVQVLTKELTTHILFHSGCFGSMHAKRRAVERTEYKAKKEELIQKLLRGPVDSEPEVIIVQLSYYKPPKKPKKYIHTPPDPTPKTLNEALRTAERVLENLD